MDQCFLPLPVKSLLPAQSTKATRFGKVPSAFSNLIPVLLFADNISSNSTAVRMFGDRNLYSSIHDGSIGSNPVAIATAPTEIVLVSSFASRLIASRGHTFTHTPQFLHFNISIMYACGTAWANGRNIAPVGHFLAQAPQFIHFLIST